MVIVVTPVATGHICEHVIVSLLLMGVCCYAVVCMSVGFANFVGLT